MKYFSVFSGIGGFEQGIDSFGECVGYSEINKYAIQVYQKHFPTHKNYGDITKIATSDLPDFDVLVGGFPCQAFSIAGKRKGFDDTRGTLFFEIARILSDRKPKLFLLENVKGLLSHENGRTFKTIISTLDELGYDLQWQVLNSKNFGVPQNRERVFIIGHLRGQPRPEVFPLRENDQLSCGENESKERRPQAKYSGTLRAKGSMDADGTYIKQIIGGAQGMRVYNPDGLAITLSSLGGGAGAKTGLYAVPLKFLDRNQKNFQGEYSFTVDTVNTGGIMQNSRIRRLTPKECERLQGFPDNWTEGLSDTQRYKCLGNAVTVNVVQYIFNKLYEI